MVDWVASYTCGKDSEGRRRGRNKEYGVDFLFVGEYRLR